MTITAPNHNTNAGQPEKLCLSCGLCCNGVLFKDVELQPTDDPVQLNELGLPLRIRSGRGANPGPSTTTIKFPQPCAALLGCRCLVYAHRPQRCRQFDCSLLLRLRAGEIAADRAFRAVRETRSAANHVLKLLRDLGDSNETLALSLRFQQLRRRLEQVGVEDEETAATYAELTLAVHDLQRRLQQSFYP